MPKLQLGEQVFTPLVRIHEDHPLGDPANRAVLVAVLLGGLELYEEQDVISQANLAAFTSNLLHFLSADNGGRFRVGILPSDASDATDAGVGICLYRRGFDTLHPNTAFILRHQVIQDRGRDIQQVNIHYARTDAMGEGIVAVKPTLPQLVHKYNITSQTALDSEILLRDRNPRVVCDRRIEAKDFGILTQVIDRVASAVPTKPA